MGTPQIPDEKNPDGGFLGFSRRGSEILVFISLYFNFYLFLFYFLKNNYLIFIPVQNPDDNFLGFARRGSEILVFISFDLFLFIYLFLKIFI